MAGQVVHVDWMAIRAEWENTDISDQALAERWGFKSKNSIRRKRGEEGWARDAAAVGAALAQQALQEDVTEDVPGGHNGGHTGTRAHGRRGESPASTGVLPIPVPAEEAISGSDAWDGEPGSQAREPYHLTPAPDRGGLTTATDLVTQQARVRARQIRVAERMIETAELFVDLLHTIGSATLSSPLGFQAIADAKERLQAINPDKDSVSTLVKSFQNLGEAGFKLMRQALSMDVEEAKPKAAAAAGQAGPEGGLPQSVAAAFRLMDETTLMSLRAVSVQLSRQVVPG